MARKTVEVEVLKQTVNKILATMAGSAPSDARYRAGMMALLEDVLHNTGNYHGFQYLGLHEVPAGNKPGINMGPDGHVSNNYELRFADTDDTRVVYI
jgi:hypothetical protein